ncbi:hypothetical protein EMWEY_00041840 [Eimeria maxima]|uniref:Uncharacterized protein n=1 Tax=Eimeria maxima TaxID=5804 RepID=U6MGF4_EIMMA|nr:hypothetical protein EMWEY_00041840 [Eimeria maxima]CDJ61524.1 hypothetical protein EMWEY_00041840 [Eimeria maxima]
MCMLTPLLAASMALLVEASGTAEDPTAAIFDSEINFLDNDLRPKWGHRKSPLVAIALLAAAVAAAILVIQCFRALQSNENSSAYGLHMRRLATGDSRSCSTLEQGVQALVWECLEALEKQSNANAGGKSEKPPYELWQYITGESYGRPFGFGTGFAALATKLRMVVGSVSEMGHVEYVESVKLSISRTNVICYCTLLSALCVTTVPVER